MEHPLLKKIQSLIQHEFANNPYYTTGLHLKHYIRAAGHCHSAAQAQWDAGKAESALVNFLRTMRIVTERIYPHRDYHKISKELRAALNTVNIQFRFFALCGFLVLWPLSHTTPCASSYKALLIGVIYLVDHPKCTSIYPDDSTEHSPRSLLTPKQSTFAKSDIAFRSHAISTPLRIFWKVFPLSFLFLI